MYGAVIGDIAGSKYEFHNIKTKDFPLVSQGCRFTDDTVMTAAIAKALLRSMEEGRPFRALAVEEMRAFGARYPNAGYGGRFALWLRESSPAPYYSYGNGSAMRVSPCGLIAVTLEEALALAKASAEVTHNHPEGIKGAQAAAAAVFLAGTGMEKADIRAYLQKNFYALDFTLDEIRPSYRFDVSCQGSVPQALTAFLEGDSYEDTVRNAISIGGDSDTIAAIAGAAAWSYYRFSPEGGTQKKPGRIWPEFCDRLVEENGIDRILPDEFVRIIDALDTARMHRRNTFDRTGSCTPITI